MTTEIEIGRGKRGRRAYSFDDVAVVPSRRTRDPKNVSLRWQIDAFEFSMPVIAAPMRPAAPDGSALIGKRLRHCAGPNASSTLGTNLDFG